MWLLKINERDRDTGRETKGEREAGKDTKTDRRSWEEGGRGGRYGDMEETEGFGVWLGL